MSLERRHNVLGRMSGTRGVLTQSLWWWEGRQGEIQGRGSFSGQNCTSREKQEVLKDVATRCIGYSSRQNRPVSGERKPLSFFSFFFFSFVHLLVSLFLYTLTYFVSLFLYTFLSVYFYICFRVCLFCLFICFCLPFCLSVCLSVLSLHQSLAVCVCLFCFLICFCLSAFLSIILSFSFCLSVFSFYLLSVFLSSFPARSFFVFSNHPYAYCYVSFRFLSYLLCPE